MPEPIEAHPTLESAAHKEPASSAPGAPPFEDALHEVTVPEENTAPQKRGSPALEVILWALAACVCTLINRFIGLVVPLPPATSLGGHGLALVYLGALLFALLQMTRSAARLPNSTPALVLVGFLLGAPMAVLLLVQRMEVVPPRWLMLTANNLFLPMGAALVGAAVGRIVRHPNTLLAAAGFSIFFDIVVVTMGTVAALTQAQSNIIAAVSVGAGPSVPMAKSYPILSGVTIGPADVLFLALFLSSVWMLRLSWRATAGWMYGLLLLALAVVDSGTLPDWLPGIPALVPMGVAVLVANWRHRAFTAQEKRDLIIGTAFALACAAAIVVISRRAVSATPQPIGVQIQRVPTGEHALVVGVLPNSRADRAGVKPGDIVLRLNRKPIKGMPQEEFDAALRDGRTKGVTMLLQSPGEGNREFAFAPPGGKDSAGPPSSESSAPPGEPSGE